MLAIASVGRLPHTSGPALIVALICAGTATLVSAGGAAGPGVIHACVQKESGSVRIPRPDTDKDDGCRANETALSWSAAGPQGPTGPQGPAGSFSGTFASPAGACSLSVLDAGITLACPSTRLSLSADGTVSLAGVRAFVRGEADAEVQGGRVLLNGSCEPVARKDDPTGGIGTVTGGIVPVTGSITAGSPDVFAC